MRLATSLAFLLAADVAMAATIHVPGDRPTIQAGIDAAAAGDTVCTDIFGNELGDWIGEIQDQSDINGNFPADPLFCDAENGDFTLSSQSPCLPGNHPDGADCGLIGAYGEGCGLVFVEPETWAGNKARYRR